MVADIWVLDNLQMLKDLNSRLAEEKDLTICSFLFLPDKDCEAGS
mgnify:CR=1 FL=1